MSKPSESCEKNRCGSTAPTETPVVIKLSVAGTGRPQWCTYTYENDFISKFWFSILKFHTSILLTSNLKYFQSESWYSRDLISFLFNLKWYGKQEVTVNHANAKQISVKAAVVRCTVMTCSCSRLQTLIVSLHVSLSSLIFCCCCCCDFHFAVDTRASSLSQWGSLTSKDLWASSPAIVPHKSSSLLTRLVQWHQKNT